MPKRVVVNGDVLLRERDWLKDEHICAMFGWSLATLRNRRSAGTAPPSSKIGKDHLTKGDDVELWIRRRRVSRITQAAT